jgi:hypothetical protein
VTATDTITPTATAIRAALIAALPVTTLVSQRIYLEAAPDTAAYPHVVMTCAAAPEADATHSDLSWQPQQWDIYAVADTANVANDIAGKVAAALNGTRLTMGSATTLIVRRQGTMPAKRLRLSDTISKFMGATTLLVGIKTGSD